METSIAPTLVTRLALAAALALLGGRATAHGPGQDAADFTAEFERARELIVDRKWKKARASIDALLEQHQGAAGLLLNRPVLVGWLEECAFWEGRADPRPADLVSGKLVRYGRSGGTLRITYTPTQLADFWVVRDEDNSELPQPPSKHLLAGRVFLHPAVFAGPYSIEIRGSAYPGLGIGTTRLPVLLVGVEPDQQITVTFGLPKTRSGNSIQWAPAKITHYRGDSEEILDDKDAGRTKPGKPFRLKVEVKASTVKASCNGKFLLSGSKERSLFGRVGFAGLGDFELLTISGKVERAWIEGLIDDAVHVEWSEFRKEYDVEKKLPEWFQREEARWGFAFPPEAYPGPPDAARLEVLEAVSVYASEGDVEEGLTYVAKLDSARHPEGFLEYLRAQLHFVGDDWEDALEACEAVCRLDPGFVPVRALRAYLLAGLGRLSAAREAMRELLAIEEMSRWTYPRLANLELLAGNQEEAGRLAVEAIEAGHFSPELDEVNAWRIKAIRGPRWREESEYTSRHFRVVSGINRRTCVEAAEILESSFNRFARDLPGDPRPGDRKFQVYVFPGQASYLAYTADVLFTERENSAGLYSPMLKQLLIWNLPERERMLQTVRHEGLHQYLDLLFEDPPYWLNEGLAEYYEVADFTRLGDNQFPPHLEHIRLLGDRGQSWAPLEKFLYLNQGRFMADPELHYAQAWALIHYLRHGPRERRVLFDDLLAYLAAGTAREEALDLTFKGTDLKALLDEVREHVQSFER